MKRLLIALLLCCTPAFAANFADADKTYMWDGTQYYPTWAETKAAIAADLMVSVNLLEYIPKSHQNGTDDDVELGTCTHDLSAYVQEAVDALDGGADTAYHKILDWPAGIVHADNIRLYRTGGNPHAYHVRGQGQRASRIQGIGNGATFAASEIATQAGTLPLLVTATAHGRTTGDIVKFDTGSALLSGNFYLITVVDADSFTLDNTDSTDFTGEVAARTITFYRNVFNVIGNYDKITGLSIEADTSTRTTLGHGIFAFNPLGGSHPGMQLQDVAVIDQPTDGVHAIMPEMHYFQNVYAEGNGRYGFMLGDDEGASASIGMNNSYLSCRASNNGEEGWFMRYLTRSVFSAPESLNNWQSISATSSDYEVFVGSGSDHNEFLLWDVEKATASSGGGIQVSYANNNKFSRPYVYGTSSGIALVAADYTEIDQPYFLGFTSGTMATGIGSDTLSDYGKFSFNPAAWARVTNALVYNSAAVAAGGRAGTHNYTRDGDTLLDGGLMLTAGDEHLTAELKRSSNNYDAVSKYRPAGTVAGGNELWTAGIKAFTNKFSLWAYNGTADEFAYVADSNTNKAGAWIETPAAAWHVKALFGAVGLRVDGNDTEDIANFNNAAGTSKVRFDPDGDVTFAATVGSLANTSQGYGFTSAGTATYSGSSPSQTLTTAYGYNVYAPSSSTDVDIITYTGSATNPIIIIRNGGSANIVFKYNSSKLRLAGGVDKTVPPLHSVMFVLIPSTTIYQEVGMAQTTLPTVTVTGTTDLQGNATVDAADTITTDTAVSSDWLKLLNAGNAYAAAVTTSAGAGDNGKLPLLNASGIIDATMLPTANITLGESGTGAETWTLPDITADKQVYEYVSTRTTTVSDVTTITCHSSDSGKIVMGGVTATFDDSEYFADTYTLKPGAIVTCISKLATTEWFCGVAGM